jgi:epoxyqueuosine reductase QueG
MRNLPVQEFKDAALHLFRSCEANRIPKEKALLEELQGVQMFQEPLIGFADAKDDLFVEFKSDTIVGPQLLTPTEWLPKARSVISFFFPYTEVIRRSNAADWEYPSAGWLNGRIEGQAFINIYTRAMVSFLENAGYAALAPSADSRFSWGVESKRCSGSVDYTSNWSERHCAHVCGLGTFSLSKGLITERGMAGRLTSVVTTAVFDPSERSYETYDEYCIMCGECIAHCPVQAISFEQGKNHQKCSDFLDYVTEQNPPWYGCGKCQVGVPCESRNPSVAE